MSRLLFCLVSVCICRGMGGGGLCSISKSVEVRGHFKVSFIVYTRPADPQTFRILLSLPPISWQEHCNYRHLHMGSADSNSGPEACATSSLPLGPFPPPYSCFKTSSSKILAYCGTSDLEESASLTAQSLSLQIGKKEVTCQPLLLHPSKYVTDT